MIRLYCSISIAVIIPVAMLDVHMATQLHKPNTFLLSKLLSNKIINLFVRKNNFIAHA